MQNLFRRPSGVWVARLVVPARLRQALGRHEFIQSTRTTDPSVGKLIGGALLVQWRRLLLEADRSAGRSPMNLEDESLLRVVDGAPVLISASHLPLRVAAMASGIGADELLRQAAAGRMRLYARHAAAMGYVLPHDDLPLDDGELGTRVVPSPNSMPASARRERLHGPQALLDDDARHAANAWLVDPAAKLTFHLLDTSPPGMVFAHDEAPALTLDAVEVAAEDVEQLRLLKAAAIAPQAVETARVRVQARASSEKGAAGLEHGSRPLLDSVETYLGDGERARGDEQRGRIRRSCEIFLALVGEGMTGAELDRECLRNYRDKLLPGFPAHDDKLRRQHGPGAYEVMATVSPAERLSIYRKSVQLAREVGWPTMSPEQRMKTFGFLSGWIEWLGQEGWVARDIADGLAQRGDTVKQVQQAKKGKTDADRRDPFTADELALIFGADWFRTGKGRPTKKGLFHTWSPYKTFVPLIGLLTGARLNEICQLNLSDLRMNAHGVWMFDLTESEFDDPDDPGLFSALDVASEVKPGKKRLKNSNSRRAVPVHSELIRLGLIEYRAALAASGNKRLFPELKWDARKGYGKAATRWFSDYLKQLGMPRDGRKVFHSLRHNVATTLQNELGGRPAVVKQLLGHARGAGAAEKIYRKDILATGPDSELVRLIEGLQHGFLAGLAPLDLEAGIQAVGDALRRKNNGRGAVED